MKRGQTVEYFTNGNFTKGVILYYSKNKAIIKTWLGKMTIPKENYSLLRSCY